MRKKGQKKNQIYLYELKDKIIFAFEYPLIEVIRDKEILLN